MPFYVHCTMDSVFGYSWCCNLKPPCSRSSESIRTSNNRVASNQMLDFVRVLLFKDGMVRINSHCNRNGFTVPDQISSIRFSAWNDLSSTWYCWSSRSNIWKKNMHFTFFTSHQYQPKRNSILFQIHSFISFQCEV